MRSSHMSFWTEGRVETLRRGWERGDPASRIAAELGGVSRNAVIGKVARLGLPGRLKPRLTPKLAAPPTVSRERTSMVRIKRKTRPSVPPPVLETSEAVDIVSGDDAMIPLAQRKSLVELTDACCHWPVGDPGTAGFFYCGGVAVEGMPYCPSHCARAYTKNSDWMQRQAGSDRTAFETRRHKDNGVFGRGRDRVVV